MDELFYISFALLIIKNLTIGSSANLFRYFTSEEYREKYNAWMKDCPK